MSFSGDRSLTRRMTINKETGEAEDLKTLWESSTWNKFEKGKGRAMERAQSFIGSRAMNTSATDGAIVIVDPFSTGAHLASAVCDAGIKCVR